MIRKAKNQDIENINLIVKEFDNNFNKHYHLDSYLLNPLYIINVYEDEDVIKGFIICTFIIDTLEVLLVFVDSKYRNKKIATLLLMNVFKCKKIKEIVLEVSIENKAALNLYQKLGFEIVSTRKKYYSGIDAYVMKKVI